MVSVSSFGKYEKYTIESPELRVSVITLGATATEITYAGRNVCLAWDTDDEYLAGGGYIGAVVGRYANRIGGARFPLNGKIYELDANENGNCLHGGDSGMCWSKRPWKAEITGENSVSFTIESADGDNGFPGSMAAKAVYTVSGSELLLELSGISDADTIFAPTTHIYFNLDGSDSILSTDLKINSTRHLEPGPGLIPTGRILANTGAFDFSSMHPITCDFDDCFITDGEDMLTAEAGGIRMCISSDLPAIQIYTGSGLEEKFGRNRGFAAEPEFYPDSPNHPEFPSPVLKAGVELKKYVRYNFSKI